MDPAILLNLMVTTTSPSARDMAACAVGRVAISDLRTVDTFSTGRDYYDRKSIDTDHRNLIEVCPSLESDVKAIMPLADAGTLAEEKDISSKSPVAIFGISLPELDADGRRAIVRMGHYCNGLCGAWFTISYVLTPNGWKRDKEISPPIVS